MEMWHSNETYNLKVSCIAEIIDVEEKIVCGNNMKIYCSYQTLTIRDCHCRSFPIF
jgi:hypothetical protein